MHELEAKFLTTDGKAPEDVLRRLQESLAWAGYRIQPKGRRSFVDRYFDTTDHQLRAAGWSYRERQDEQGRRIALKEVTRSRAAVFDREEVEQPLGRDEDLASPKPGPVKDRLSNLLHPDADVAPLFTVVNQRSAYSLSHPDHPRGLVEMAFDEARIQAGESVEFKELALELKNGAHELLANILAAVELEPALIEARLSKFERGLLTAGLPLERRAGLKPKRLDRHSRWLDLAVAQLKTELYRIKLYEPHAWEGLHPEGVYQMRLAARRGWAALQGFSDVLPVAESADLAPRLRRLAAVLGRVRDLDVHEVHLDAYRKGIEPGERPALERYAHHLARLRQASRQVLVGELGGDAYAGLITSFNTLLNAAVQAERPSPLRVEDAARDSLEPLLERVLRGGRAIDDKSPNRHLHRLRMDAKRLRYQLEFLHDPYAQQTEPALAALKRLQERLGLLHDASAAKSQLTRYRRMHAAGDRERELFKRLVKLEKKRVRRHRERFRGDWQAFDAAAADLPERL